MGVWVGGRAGGCVCVCVCVREIVETIAAGGRGTHTDKAGLY